MEGETRDDFVCATVIKFADGAVEAMLLHRGDRASCIKCADLCPAVAISDPRRVIDSNIIVLRGSEWDDL